MALLHAKIKNIVATPNFAHVLIHQKEIGTKTTTINSCQN